MPVESCAGKAWLREISCSVPAQAPAPWSCQSTYLWDPFSSAFMAINNGPGRETKFVVCTCVCVRVCVYMLGWGV